MHRQVNGQRGAGRAEGGQRLAIRHGRGPAEVRVSTTDCATPGSVSSAPARRRRRMPARPASRHGAPQRTVAAQLFTHGRPDRQIARMQPRNVMALGMGGGDFADDLVKVHRGGVFTIRAPGGQWPSSCGTGLPA